MSMRRSLFLKSTGVAIMAFLLIAISVESRESGKSESRELESTATLVTLGANQSNDEAIAIPSLADSESADDAKVLLLTIRPTGFEPNQLTLPAGKYLLVTRNRTGLDEFTLRLAGQSGERLYETRARRYRRDLSYFLQLTPGNYVLTEVNHPEWASHLTITAR